MIEEPPVLTVTRPARRPTDVQIAAFQGIPTGFVVDAMFGKGAMDRRIASLGDGRDLPCTAAGPALTADCAPGDILAVLAALDFVRPGDVLVSAFAGFQGCAAAGDRVLGMARNSGAVGFVTDGPVRDYTGITGVGLPVWCTGLTPASPFSTGPGQVGSAIQIGGQQVATGDMIVADRDGVVVVPFDRIDAVITALDKVAELETALDADVAAGLKVPEAIAELLKSDAVRFQD